MTARAPGERVGREPGIGSASSEPHGFALDDTGLWLPSDTGGTLSRRVVLGSLIAGAGLLTTGATQSEAARPTALIYRGPASSPGTAQAVAVALRHRNALNPVYVGPSQRTRLTAAVLRRATLYVQPGGDTVAGAWPHMRPYRRMIVDWVRGGGHYLGLCLGAYLAADDPGFGLWPGAIADYKRTRGTDIPSARGRLATIRWRGRSRTMYVEDPPVITPDRRLRRLSVLARYRSGHIAAASVPVGRGRVTLVGPHPEAPPSWYRGGPRRWQPGAWIDTERSAIAP